MASHEYAAASSASDLALVSVCPSNIPVSASPNAAFNTAAEGLLPMLGSRAMKVKPLSVKRLVEMACRHFLNGVELVFSQL